jgi:HSP20 family protein
MLAVSTFDRLFGDNFYRDFSISYTEEKEGVITLSVDMPGVKKEGLTVAVDRGILSVIGERRDRSQKYSKRWRLGEDADIETASASLEDGVLTLRIPRKTGQLARKIPIS